jgi:hypothetical protein
MVGGPNGHRSNGSEIEGRPDARLKTGVPNGVARRGAQRGRTGCPTGGQTGCLVGVPDGAKRVPRHFLNATSSATSFLNAMSPV